MELLSSNWKNFLEMFYWGLFLKPVAKMYFLVKIGQPYKPYKPDRQCAYNATLR
jgi:hypothetical protein